MAQEFVLAWHKGVAFAVVCRSVWFQKLRCFGARGEDKAEARLEENGLHNLFSLQDISWEIEPSLVAAVVLKAVVSEHIVDAEVASIVRHVINTRMRKVREDIAFVQPSHCDLGATHLQEGGKR